MTQSRSVLCTAGIVASVLLIAAGAASADSGIGFDNYLSNALTNESPPLAGSIDPDGYSIISWSAFSPSGIMYPLVIDYQYLPLNDEPATAAKPPTDNFELNPGWSFGGAFAIGYLANFGTTDTASFREFTDWSEAPVLSGFKIQGLNLQSGEHLSFSGGSIGRNDQFFRLNYGRYGDYDINAWFNQIPHTFSSNARVLWNGAGTGQLTLPGGLEPGASSAQAIRDILFNNEQSTLKLERKRGGLAITATPWKNIELFFNSNTEWRDGTRPFGGTFNYPTLGQVSETVEPINYVTQELDLGFRYAGATYQANFIYNGSLFFNDTETLVWENPGLSLFQPDFTPEQGRFALAPDNQFHQLKLDFAALLPFLGGRWTTSIAYNRKTQDQQLLPPTISTGIGNNTGIPVNFDLWNTTAALSQTSADARIQTMFAQAELSLQPSSQLRTTLEFRYLDEDNDTDYTAFNPLTGEFGYIPEDGGFLFNDGIFQPGRAGDLLRFRSVPFAKDEISVRLNADYRLASSMKLGLSYEHLEEDHDHRERGELRDDRVRLQFTDRSGPWASLRAAAEYARRSGDDYDLNPFSQFLSSNLPGFVPLFGNSTAPRELADLQVFDLSSRNQLVADLQLRFTIGLRSDLAFSANYQRDDFNAEFGLRETEQISANAEWNYQFDDNGNSFLYYSYQSHDRNAANINDIGPAGTDPTAGGDVFPLENAWRQALNESHHAAGIGFTRQWNKLLLEADYSFGYSSSRLGFSFNSAGALTAGVDINATGTGFPNQTFEQHLVRLSLRYPITDKVAARVFYHLESEDINDFHFDGLTDPVVDNQLFLLAVPEDFTAHVVGIFVEVTL